MANSCPTISHLFFADYSLIFFRATREDAMQVRQCLQVYEKASEQMINYDKSALTFSPSTSHQSRVDMADIMSVNVVYGHDVYLGLPTFSLRNKRLQFGYLHERIEQKLRGWTNRFISMGGREVLIKSVLQAIPSYAMSCFKLPVSLCHRIEQICAKFWWNGSFDQSGMHWMNWQNLCRPKCVGGMSFRNMTAFSKALAKQIWRIIRKPNSLMTKVLKARYFKNKNIMQTRLGSNPSYIWRSILWSRDLIEKKLCWRVGDGKKILAKLDQWIPSVPLFHSKVDLLPPEYAKVNNFITNFGSWNEEAVRRLFPEIEAEAILNIPLNRLGGEYIRFWIESKNGKYIVRDGYHLANNSLVPHPFQSKQPNLSWWKTLWKLNISPKIRIFLWRASLDIIPSPTNLFSHHVPVEESCFLCNFYYASTSHCILFCRLVRNVWKNTIFWNCLKSHIAASFLDCILYVSKVYTKEELELFVILCWAIWNEVCHRKHENINKKSEFRLTGMVSLVINLKISTLALSRDKSDTHQPMVMSWQPPISNHFRLGVDAGFDNSRNIYSIGQLLEILGGWFVELMPILLDIKVQFLLLSYLPLNVEWIYV